MLSLLIVDDEAAIAEGLQILFQESALEFGRVTACTSGERARELLEGYPYDILVLDIMMPGMTGLEFLEQVRRSNKRAKCIFLTGYSSFSFAQKAIHLQAFDYLLKPADDGEVLETVRRAMVALEAELAQLLELHTLRALAEGQPPHHWEGLISALLDEGGSPASLSPGEAAQLRELFGGSGQASIALIRVDNWGALEGEGRNADLNTHMQTLFRETADAPMAVRTAPDGMLQCIAGGSQPEPFLRKRLEAIQDSLYASFGVMISYAFLHGAGFRELRAAYRHLSGLLRQNLIPGQAVSAGSTIQFVRDRHLLELLDRMLVYMREGRESAFRACIEGLLDSGLSPGNSGLAYFYIRLSREVMDMAFDYDIQELMRPHVVEKLTNLYAFANAQELKGFLLDLYGICSRGIRGAGQRSPGQFIGRVKRYIVANLAGDLSLDFLAQQFQINPSYLSRIFRECTGETLSAYIGEKRMAEAKRLLTATEKKVYWISEQVGFQNPNYFAKVFRRSTGISPQEFRGARLP